MLTPGTCVSADDGSTLSYQEQVAVHQNHVAALVTRDVRVTIEAADKLDWPRANENDPVPLNGDQPCVTRRAGDLIRVARVLKPDFIQSWASIEHREFIDEGGDLSKFMLANDIRFIAMMPFGQGRILGKYDSKNPPSFGKGDNRTGNPEFQEDSLRAFTSKLEMLRSRFGQSSAELIVPALGFLLQFPAVISVIPGFRNSRQVKEILNAAAQEFSLKDREFIESAFPLAEAKPHPWTE